MSKPIFETKQIGSGIGSVIVLVAKNKEAVEAMMKCMNDIIRWGKQKK